MLINFYAKRLGESYQYYNILQRHSMLQAKCYIFIHIVTVRELSNLYGAFTAEIRGKSRKDPETRMYIQLILMAKGYRMSASIYFV